MMDKENCGGMGMGGHMMHACMSGPHKKEFKLAMLEKKQRILEAKLDFIKKMKEMVEKSPDKDEE
jgi:hypothetical protein